MFQNVTPWMEIPGTDQIEYSQTDPPSEVFLDFLNFQSPQAHEDSIVSPTTQCQCLSAVYVQLSALQSSPPPSFPYSLGAPGMAMKVAQSTLQCQSCPDEFAARIQNLMLLTTLLTLITNEYAKLLGYIDQKASLADSVPFRMGENAPEQMHLHTGTPDCPMGVNVNLSAEDFRRMAKKIVRERIFSSPHASEITLTGLLEALQRRQETWHRGGGPKGFVWSRQQREETGEGEETAALCMRMIGNVRQAIEALPFD